MKLNRLVMGLLLIFSTIEFGHASHRQDDFSAEYYNLKEVSVYEVSQEPLTAEVKKIYSQRYYNLPGIPDQYGEIDNIERGGRIIATARELVAFGEDLYALVTKGKPTVNTDYTPISVIPKQADGSMVELLDTEGWKVPNKATFEVVCKNFYGMVVVKFRYSIIWSYGGTYNGKGRYITAAQIVPESVFTLFGFDFAATMRLGGIQNNGTVANPVAGATLIMEYSASTFLRTSTKAEVFFITGTGKFKKI